MGIGSVTFGGLASGLDTSAIISAILSVEARPIQLLESQKSEEQRKISLVGTFEGLVKSLQEKAQALTGDGSFFAYAVDASSEDVASYSVSGDVATGNHDLTIEQLAQSDRHAFDAVSDADPDLGAGTISFDYDGESYSIDVASDASSLNEIATQINDEAGGAVSASVINTGTDITPSYQLVVTGNDTGDDFQVENLTSSVASLGTATELTDAQNARITIDTLVIERSTNVFEDVIEGLTITAQTTGSTSLNVSVDEEGSKEKLQEVLDAYNEVVDFMNAQNSYSEEGGAGGELFGDSLLRTVRTAFTNALFNVDLTTVQADTEGFSTLGLVGVELDSDGRLSIDDATFGEKLEQDRSALAGLFTDSSDGLFVRLDEEIDGLLESTTSEVDDELVILGAFDLRRETFNGNIDRFDDRIERLERNLEQLEETLVLRFANLESVMTELNSQSSFLASNLASLA